MDERGQSVLNVQWLCRVLLIKLFGTVHRFPLSLLFDLFLSPFFLKGVFAVLLFVFTPTALHIEAQGRSLCDLPWVVQIEIYPNGVTS